jgi:site-specific DNA-cytosine methylase
MNVLSCFDGMSCAQIALERAGIEVDNYYASEVDKWAIKVTQANYPMTVQAGSVKNILTAGDYMYIATLYGDEYGEKIDLLIGGSPCQGFSFAGKQLNFDDPRSKLFWEFVRLRNELKPRYFLLENVRMKQEYQDVISEALGVQPININSNLVSAQLRNRLYWTNIPGVIQPKDKHISLESVIDDGCVDREKSYCIDANYFKGGNLKSYAMGRRQLVFTDDSFTKFRKLTPTECERLQTVPDGYTDHVSNTQRYKMLGNGFTVDVIAHILKGMKS